MTDQIIDKRTVFLPGPMGDVTPAAREERRQAQQASADAQAAAAKSDADASVCADAVARISERITWDEARQWFAPIRYRHMVAIGDSWGEGYYKGAKHRGSGWPEKLAAILQVGQLDNMCVSASGFLNAGDSKTFPQQWDAVTSKSDVDLVVVLGGQNDASSGKDLGQLATTLDGMVSRIMADTAGGADVHVFPMCLSYGEKLGSKKFGEDQYTLPRRLTAYQALKSTGALVGPGTRGKTLVHDGCYRWGFAVGRSDSDTDGAHLLEAGYARTARMMASCIVGRNDYWPVFASGFADSNIPGTWRYNMIEEQHGTLLISCVVDYTAKLSNGWKVTTLPDWAVPANSHYIQPGIDPGKYFLSVDGGGVAVQAANTGASGTMSIDVSVPAGIW